MKIVYHLYLNHTGYSIAAQEYVFALHRSRPDVEIKCKLFHNNPIGVSRHRTSFFKSHQSTPSDYEGAVSIFQSVPETYVQHEKTKLNVGLCVFESISLPLEWSKKMNGMDRIVTASEFNKGIFQANGVNKPIRVVPHCFDPDMFHKDIKPFGRYALTTFLAMGQWKERKNWETLIRAFYDAFSKKDNVCLLIKTDRADLLAGAVTSIKRHERWRSKDTCPIYSEPKTLCQFEEIPHIMKKADFYISTSLGEGFGLAGLHAMALGIPVITTRFGGALEYARSENCTYIEPCKYQVRPTMDNIPQFRNAIWPVVTVEEVSKQMRQAFDHYPIDKTRVAYEYVHTHFTYTEIGHRYYEALTNDIST